LGAPACEHPRVRVAALVLIDGEVLVVRHRKAGRTYHLLPGGGVEPGESLAAALEREVREETGLVVSVRRPLVLNDTIAPLGERHLVNITFSADVRGGVLSAPADDERIAGVELVDPATLPELDLRPPIAEELVEAVAQADAFQTVYLGPRYVEEGEAD